MAGYPSIRHGEECMRDGMQIESRAIPVADKIRLLDALSETGLKEIAVGSFVSPRWTPQMADVEDVIQFHPKPGVRYTAAAFNDRGRERARAAYSTAQRKPRGRGHASQHVRRLRPAELQPHATGGAEALARRGARSTRSRRFRSGHWLAERVRLELAGRVRRGAASAAAGPPAPGLERGGHQGHAREHRRSDQLELATPCGATPG